MADQNRSALFICLGNICRSPMAEAVMRQAIKDRGIASNWSIDSAGLIDYHRGKQPYHMTMEVLQGHNIKDYSHKARQLTKADFSTFDYIFGMDHENMRQLEAMKPKSCKARCLLLGTFDPKAKTPNDVIIDDPYYESKLPLFEIVYEQCVRSVDGFLDDGHKEK